MAEKKCDVRHKISGKEHACKCRIFNSLAGHQARKPFRSRHLRPLFGKPAKDTVNIRYRLIRQSNLVTHGY